MIRKQKELDASNKRYRDRCAIRKAFFLVLCAAFEKQPLAVALRMAKIAHGDQPPQRSFRELKQAEMAQELDTKVFKYLQPENEPEQIQIQAKNLREQDLNDEKKFAKLLSFFFTQMKVCTEKRASKYVVCL